MIELVEDAGALARLAPDDIARLTDSATAATFYAASLSDEQIAANKRIITISTASCAAAAANPHQAFIAAFDHDRLAGFVISTRHAENDRELDWLMVHPDFHGTAVSRLLMERGIAWLGADQPMWLNVIAFNHRAIRFYEKFGFAIDAAARTHHLVPHVIMRRPAIA
ncbi:GNAT family N-acetyltransferase [Vitreimonas flagellata]|uniref:GNAT family N-acetyltransferase n=1 Tax=Vitreimonas flagellata TaxID=2560861 RepID=UPI0014310A3A|nr:GNAT family N-acetyltransferase [Vitreimonas flagellata]